MTLVHTKLKKTGKRTTTQRTHIFNVLSCTPQSVQSITHKLKDINISVDKATVYRTLECFVDLGLVNKTSFDNKTSVYERTSHHHHHVCCTQCGEVEDIALNEQLLVSQAAKQTSFTITKHTLEFFGVCKKCREIYEA